MNQPTCYLAGAITGATYAGAVDWREYAKDRLADNDIIGLSPMRWKQYLREGHQIEDSYDEYPLCTSKGITARDRFDCQRSDVVLMNMLGAKYASIGTCIEVGWADAARRPIVAVLEPGNVHNHSMFRECSGFIVSTLDEGLDIVTAILSP